MIIIKEKVKDFPTLIFLMIFDFWAGTVCDMIGEWEKKTARFWIFISQVEYILCMEDGVSNYYTTTLLTKLANPGLGNK